jgi:NlpC/P60 family putative phage cell wall peptidase
MTEDYSPGDDVVTLARRWLGTPYHHQAAVRGQGCDCLGLVRGVYAELYGAPAEEPSAYSRDLAEATGVETLIEAAARHLAPVDFAEAGAVLAGDVVIFRLRAAAMAKHCAILTGSGRMIHAFEGGPVCEVNLSDWWRRRIAAVFRFPEQPWP